MTTSTPASNDLQKLDTRNLDATANMLNDLTNKAQDGNGADPKTHLHTPAPHPDSHAWFRAVFPYNSLADIEASWHLGNYVIDRKTGTKVFEPMSIYVRLGMHLLYYGSEQENVLHWERTQKLLKEQSEKMGKQYDDPASKDHIVPFIESFELQDSLKDLKEQDLSKYKNFNEFFARELKENARPIAEPENDLVVSSVADCRLTTYPTVDLATKYWIKGFGFTIGKLLNDETLAKTFEGGSIAIARLAPQDYHRWHAPTDGEVVSISDVPGTYYTVNPQAINEPGTLDVFCENKRSVMLLKRTATGSPIAVIAVGAMLVGSIRYNDGIAQGATVRRGQCLGAFLYGGSTVITLLPPGEVVFDSDLLQHSTEQECETQVSVGWRIGAGPATRT